MECRICERMTVGFGSARVMQKYDVSYFRCPVCGFVQSEEPYWLEEAYSVPIAAGDVGLVSRNVQLAKTTERVIKAGFSAAGRFLDFGGGYGLLVRLMRDAGYDFYRYDRWCPNLFAQGLDWEPATPPPQFELVTAYEVLEHLTEPVPEIERMLQLSRNVLFSTVLLPPGNPGPGQWWYYTPESGQHVSLYTRRALETLAERFQLRLLTDGQGLHLLTEKAVRETLFRLAVGRRSGRWLDWWRRRKSLLADDLQRLTGRQLA